MLNPMNMFKTDTKLRSGYDVDEATHTVTHHVQGSVTRDLLVGKDLPRVFQFTSDGHLVIRSARPDEHWWVTWEHY